MTAPRIALFALGLLAAPAACQQAWPDPYAGDDAEARARLGYEAAAPFPLGSRHGTADVSRELGLGPLCWVETRHFRIGADLGTQRLPDDGDARRALQAECEQLRARCRAIPARPREIDCWLHVHLFAQRLEALYDDFAGRAGVDADWLAAHDAGPHLGRHDKFVVLLFERESSLARYLRRFADSRQQTPSRLQLPDADALAFVTTASWGRGRLRDPWQLRGHVRHAVVQCLVDAFSSSEVSVPEWWRQGLAHWYLRQLDPELVEAAQAHGAVPWQPGQWPEKVRARLAHDLLPELEDVLHWPDCDARDEADHAVLWSLADLLMSRGDASFRRFLLFVREHPMRSRLMPQSLVLAWHQRALQGAYGLDVTGLAAAWHEHVRRRRR